MGQNSDRAAGVAAPASRVLRWSGGLSCALVATGIGVRVYQWVLNRSLWLDEAYLAVNLVERDLAGLLRPLEYDQSAPYLFLAATDLLASVFGYDERVLRLLPLVASIAALVLFWRLLVRTVAPEVVPLGVGIFALSYPLVFYAQELKQYAVEVFLVVWVLYLLVRLLETGRGGGARGWGTLWSVGAVGLFASHTLPFCLAGVGLVLAWERWRGRIGVAWSALIAGGAAWALLFAVNYVLFIRPNYDNPFMRDYWAFAHPGAPWTLQGLKAWKELVSVYVGYVGFHNFPKVVFVLAILLGTVSTIRPLGDLVSRACLRRLESGAGVGVKGAAAAGLVIFGLAVLAGKAPFYGRLSLFMLPILLLLASCGVSELFRRGRKIAAWVVLGVLVFGILKQFPAALRRIELHDQRTVIACLGEQMLFSDQVYATEYALPGIRFYAPELYHSSRFVAGIDAFERARSSPGDSGPGRTELKIDRLIGDLEARMTGTRIWVLTVHMASSEDELDRAICTRLGLTRVHTIKRRGASAFLYVPQ